MADEGVGLALSMVKRERLFRLQERIALLKERRLSTGPVIGLVVAHKKLKAAIDKEIGDIERERQERSGGQAQSRNEYR